MDIDKMEAGPEMNALVAERVMGWQKIRDPLAPKGTTNRYRYVDKDWLGNDRRLPKFSTDISPAWLVVEKMLEKHEAFHLEYIPDKQWYAMFWFATYFTSADTAPLAICRAALKAVE